MKSRNVRDIETSKLEDEETRLAEKTHLGHGERDLLGAIRTELKRRRKTTAHRSETVSASS